jgi:RNA polymerase sigma-70 factor (ECF subfamily)
MPQVLFVGDEEQCLVKRLQEGDKTAAREFYSLYADILTGICARYLSDEEDVKDVFQNALVHIFSHISDFRYRGAGSLEAWATKIVVNESLKFLRRRERHRMVPIDNEILDEMEEEFPSIIDIPPETFQQMLNRLPVGYRTVLNLYVFEGKSHQEIARLLGIRKESSASQLHRAKNMLIKMIRKYNDENPQ